MKKYSFVAALLAGLATSVTAAQAQSPTVNWTGFYIGGHGGYQWSTIDLGFESELPGLGDGVSLDTDGGMGGVHGGVQQQFGNWVLGVELSGDWGNGDGSATSAWELDGLTLYDGRWFDFRYGPFASGTETAAVDLNNLFLAVGRVGYAWDNVLLFFKGGFASAEIGTAASFSGAGGVCIVCNVSGFPPDGLIFPSAEWAGSGSTSERHNGFALGGGFDWMIWKNVSFGVDYTYVNLGSETHSGTLNGDLSFCEDCGFDFDANYKIKVDPDDIHYVNARLTLHFNGSSP
jgi:outer membrane immunogenic protein